MADMLVAEVSSALAPVRSRTCKKRPAQVEGVSESIPNLKKSRTRAQESLGKACASHRLRDFFNVKDSSGSEETKVDDVANISSSSSNKVDNNKIDTMEANKGKTQDEAAALQNHSQLSHERKARSPAKASGSKRRGRPPKNSSGSEEIKVDDVANISSSSSNKGNNKIDTMEAIKEKTQDEPAAALGNCSQPSHESKARSPAKASGSKRRGRPPKKLITPQESCVDEIIDLDSSRVFPHEMESHKYDVSKGKTERSGLDEEAPFTFVYSDMWTQKYAPSTFGRFVGNTAAVQQLELWLKQWKEARKTPNNADSASSSSGSHQDGLCNAMFIKGPPGVGKTALVYYVANMLGYKVIEVNSSSERSGRRVLADLQEATQSRHVEGTKVSTGKGVSSFFKPILKSSEPGQSNSASPAATATPRLAIGKAAVRSSDGRKTPHASTAVNGKGTISYFFSSLSNATPILGSRSQGNKVCVISDESSSEPGTARDLSPEPAAKEPRSSIKAFFMPAKKKCETTSPLPADDGLKSAVATGETITKSNSSSSAELGARSGQNIKCSDLTIILFDDVDVVFDDEGDEGFWLALETVVKNSKKPCILTATRGSETIIKRRRTLQNAAVVELHRPSPTQVAALVRTICADEGRDVTNYDIDFMCQYFASDVRRILLQVEYETISSKIPQSVYPVEKTFGELFDNGDRLAVDAPALQIAFKRSGFNALYASLEECLPFDFADVDSSASGLSPSQASGLQGSDRCSTMRSPLVGPFDAASLNDLAQVFDCLSHSDLFTGALDMMGEECLPTYERAKRWIEQCPIEVQDVSPYLIEELVDVEARVLLRGALGPLKSISERCAVLERTEQEKLQLPQVKNALQFRAIHKKLKKIRINERALGTVLAHFPVGRSTAREYLSFLVKICQAEGQRRDKPKRNNRFLHYLPQIGLYFSSEQISRIAGLWSQDRHK